MSAFLGPIHHWLYNKIQIQGQMVDAIIRLNEKDNLVTLNLRYSLEEKYGVSETRPLVEVIDESNIHGWLQEHVSQVEFKLAEVVTMILNQDKEFYSKLDKVVQTVGEELAFEGDLTLKEIYKEISDTLLDGMPCDHANALLSETDDEVVWKREVCVHSEYWLRVGGDVNNYYKLRDAFIKGLLSKIDVAMKKRDESTFALSRK